MEKIKKLHFFISLKAENSFFKERFFVFQRAEPAPEPTSEPTPEPTPDSGRRIERREGIEETARMERRTKSKEVARGLTLDDIDKKLFDSVMDDADEDVNMALLAVPQNVDNLVEFANTSPDHMEKILDAIDDDYIKIENLSGTSFFKILKFYGGSDTMDDFADKLYEKAIEEHHTECALRLGAIFAAGGFSQDKMQELAEDLYEEIEDKDISVNVLNPVLVSSLAKYFTDKHDSPKAHFILGEAVKDPATASKVLEARKYDEKLVREVYSQLVLVPETIKRLDHEAVNTLMKVYGKEPEKILPLLSEDQKYSFIISMDRKDSKQANLYKAVFDSLNPVTQKTVAELHKEVSATPATATGETPAEAKPAEEKPKEATDTEKVPESLLGKTMKSRARYTRGKIGEGRGKLITEKELEESAKNLGVNTPLDLKNDEKLVSFTYILQQYIKKDAEVQKTYAKKINLLEDGQFGPVTFAALKLALKNKAAEPAAEKAPTTEGSPSAVETPATRIPGDTTEKGPAAPGTIPTEGPAPLATTPEVPETKEEIAAKLTKLEEKLKAILIGHPSIAKVEKGTDQITIFPTDKDLSPITINVSNKTSVLLTYKRFGVGDLHMETIGKIDDAPLNLRKNIDLQIVAMQTEKADYADNGFNLNLDTFEIKDIDEDFQIPEFLSNFSDADWVTKFDLLKNSAKYKNIFATKPFKASDGLQAPEILRTIVQEDNVGNDEVSFAQILEHTKVYKNHDTDDFKEEIKALKEEIKKNPNDGAKISRLRELYDIYLQSMKIMRSLQGEKLLTPKEAANQTDTARPYIQKLTQILQASFAKDKDEHMPWFLIEWLTSGKDPAKMALYKTADWYYDVGKIWRQKSPEAFAEQLLEDQYINIENDSGAKITVKLYDITNGVKKYDDAAIKQYINYILRLGEKFKRADASVAEAKYDFDDAAKEKHTVGLDPLPTTQEEWGKIENYDAVKAVLMAEPFNLKETEAASRLTNYLKGVDKKVNLDNIFTYFLTKNIKDKYTPKNPDVKTINDFESFKEEWEWVADELEDGENPEYLSRLLQLNVYMDQAVIFGRKLAKLGIKAPTLDESYDKIKLKDGETLLTADFNEDRMSALKSGYSAKLGNIESKQLLHLEKTREAQYSKYPRIKKIQETLVKNGYPALKIKSIEQKIIAAGTIHIKGSEVIDGSLSIPIDLGEGFSLVLTGTAKGANVMLAYQIYKNENSSGTVALGGGVNFGKEITPTAQFAYIHTEKITQGTDIVISAGVLFTPMGVIVGGMIGFDYNEERDTLEIFRGKRRESGFGEIDDLIEKGNNTAALEKIKKHSQFQQFVNDPKSKLDDEDLLSLYKAYQTADNLAAMDESNPGVPLSITGFGVGAGWNITTGAPVIFVGIKIKIGSATIFKPKAGERARLAKEYSALQIFEQLEKQTIDQLKTGETIKIYDEKSPEIYRTEDGRYGILTSKEEVSVTEGISNLEALKKSLQAHQMDAEIVEVNIHGKVQKLIELKIHNSERKDTDLFIDQAVRQWVIFHEGKILLPGDLAGLTITREKFKFHAPKFQEEGQTGASMEEIIVISRDGKFDREKVISESKNLLTKSWRNNVAYEWQIKEGAGENGKQRIFTLADFEKNYKQLDQFGTYTESIAGMTKEEYADVSQDTKELKTILRGKTPEEIKAQTLREKGEGFNNWNEFVNNKYNQLKGKIKAGNPAIYDAPSIIEAVNTSLKSGEAKLNAKEAGNLYNTFLEKYFVNIWNDGGGKNGILKAFKENNGFITSRILKPQFQSKIEKLGIAVPANFKNAGEYALHLAQKVQSKSLENFQKVINGIKVEDVNKAVKDKTLQSFLKTLVTPLEKPEQYMFGSCTTIRKTKKGAIVKTPLSAEMPTGMLGERTTWDLNSPDKETQDIAKILMDIMSPVPEKGKLSMESLHSTLVYKLATLQATRIKLGNENYEQIENFYKLNEAEQKNALNNPETAKALLELTDFAAEVRERSLKGEKSIKITDNVTLGIENAAVETGAYAFCGNLSMLTGEQFKSEVRTKEGGILVASTSNDVVPDVDIREDAAEITLGVSWEPDVPPEVPPDIPPDEQPEPEPTPGAEVQTEIPDVDPNTGKPAAPKANAPTPTNYGGNSNVE